MATNIKISPSMLAADFGAFREGANVLAAAGADYLHLDIMDGRFVPNITFGPQLLRALRESVKTPFDVHMMVVEPDRMIDEFVDAGADMITVHPEVCYHLHRVVHQIKDCGVKASVAINPATPLDAIEWILPDLDRVLIMTVNPGFGAQKFLPEMLTKIERLREYVTRDNLATEIAVDGGIGISTARSVVVAGADVLIAGTAIFADPAGPAAAMASLMKAARGE